MRRVICLVLALVLMLSMACTVFASAPSSGNQPGTGGSCTGGKDHDWDSKTGKCKVCGEECDHEFKNGKCTECGMKCDHEYKDGKCTICGAKKSSNGNPKTGDMLIVPMCGLMVTSLAGMAVVSRKKEN